jgi:hypothetical protein
MLPSGNLLELDGRTEPYPHLDAYWDEPERLPLLIEADGNIVGLFGRRRLDPVSWDRLRLTCAGWWMGWLSATIARAVFPPPGKLEPAAERRLGIASLALVALGLGSVVRFLSGGKGTARL